MPKINVDEDSDSYKKILKENALCIVATSSKLGKPDAALVEYVADSENNIYFVTNESYRKYKNLKENPYASVVITIIPQTLQIQGKAVELSGNELNMAINLLTSKLGESPKMYPKPGWKFFKITPTEMRIAIYPKSPNRFKNPAKDLM